MTHDLDSLVLAHLETARRVAARCRRRWRPPDAPEDWAAEAYLGLVRAAHSYDPARGAPGPYLAAKVAFHLADHLRLTGPRTRGGRRRPGVAALSLELPEPGGPTGEPLRETVPDRRAGSAGDALAGEVLLDLVERLAGRRLRLMLDRVALGDATQAQAAAEVGLSESGVSRALAVEVPRLALAGRV